MNKVKNILVPHIAAAKQRARSRLSGEETYRGRYRPPRYPSFSAMLTRLWSFVPSGGSLPEEVWQQRHHFLLGVTWFHAAVIALIGPAAGYSWELSLHALVHDGTVLHTLGEGLIVASFATLAYLKGLKRSYRTAAVVFALMTASAILVHLSGGYIEFHFHFFVMLTFLALYQDWGPYSLAILYVAIHHGVVGVLWPEEVYNHTGALEAPWTWAAIHAFFVLWASVGSVIAWRFNEKAAAQTRMILDSAGEGIYGLDREGNITFVNPAAARMLGLEERSIVGKKMHEVVRHTRGDGSPFPGATTPLLAPLKDGAAGRAADELFWRKDGKSFPVDYTTTPIFERGQLTGAVVTSRNVSGRKQTEQDLQLRYQELSALYALLGPVTQTGDLTKLLDDAVAKIMHITGADGASIQLVEEKTGRLTLAAYRGFSETYKHAMPMEVKRGDITGQVLSTGKPLISANLQTDRRISRGLLASEGFRSAAYLPLKTLEKTFGIITLASRKSRHLLSQKEELLIAIAHQVAVTLENIHLLEETQRKNRELQGLYTISSATTQSLDLDATVQSALLKTIEVLQVDAGRLYIFDESRNVLHLTAHHGLPPGDLKEYEYYPPGEGIVGNIFKECQPVVISDVNTDPGYAAMARSKVAVKWGFRSLIGLPITIKGRSTGVIYLYGRLVREFAAQDLQLLAAIGAHIGVAIENARLFEETERRAREISALNAVTTTLSASLDLDEILEKSLDAALLVTGMETGYIQLLSTDPSRMALKVHHGISQAAAERLRGRMRPGGKTEQILASKKSIVLQNIGPDYPGKLQGEGITAAAWAPITFQEKVLGLIGVATRGAQTFSADQVHLLESIGASIGVALEKARLFEKVSKKSQELESLVGINRDVASLLDREILLPRIAEEARKILKVDGSVFRLVEGEHLVLRGASDPETLKFRPKLRPDESVSGKIIQENRVIAIRNVLEDPTIIGEHQEVLRQAGYRSFLGIPLRAKDHVIGSLNFYSKKEREFQPEEIATITAFADQAAIAIENARLYEETHRQEEIQKLLKELSQDTTALDVDSLAKKLTEKIREFFKVDVADIKIVDHGVTRDCGISGVDPKLFQSRSQNNLRGRSRWIIENRKPLTIPDITQDGKRSGGKSLIEAGIRGFAGIPLFGKGGAVIGFLRALTYQPREFTQEEVDLLQQLANGTAVALENARLFHEAERRAREQAVLNAIAMATSGLVNMEELLATALDKVMEVTNRDCGYIRLKDPITGKVTFPAHKGISEEYVEDLLHRRTPGGHSDQVFESGELLIINDLEGKTLKPKTLRQGLRSVAWIPLKARGRVLGIMNLSTTGLTSFTPREEELLKAIGSVIGVALENAGLFENIRRHAEDLRRTRDHLENIFNSLDREMFWSSDPRSGALLYVSQGTENIYGLSREAFSTSPAFWKQVVHPEDAPIAEAIEQEIQAGKKVKQEYRIIRPKTAEVRWVQTRIIPVLGEGGKVSRIDGLLIDVTESKQAEEALAQKAEELARSNTELQHFAYIASHDLQEPLRMVAGYTQLLAKRYKNKLDSDAREFIDFAVDGVVRMQALINALLAYSRIGTKGKEFEPTDLKTALDYALSNLRAAIQESGAVVTHDLLPTVMGDSTQIGQLLQNLIGNAIKFRGKEPPRIHISSRQNGKEWLFAVKDNGIGIDSQYAERIFVIFQRLHNKQEYPGTGIGLALCKKIVERHGGRIWMESRPGEGATFHFTMPT